MHELKGGGNALDFKNISCRLPVGSITWLIDKQPHGKSMPMYHPYTKTKSVCRY